MEYMCVGGKIQKERILLVRDRRMSFTSEWINLKILTMNGYLLKWEWQINSKNVTKELRKSEQNVIKGDIIRSKN